MNISLPAHPTRGHLNALEGDMSAIQGYDNNINPLFDNIINSERRALRKSLLSVMVVRSLIADWRLVREMAIFYE